MSGDIDKPLDVCFSCNDQLFFEILKMKIRSVSISYSIGKAKEKKKTLL